jgi:arsenate reductase-like glutaredoxin family protein
MMMCFFLIMFFYNLICGKSNNRLTQNWFDANKEFFKENYKKIGISADVLEKLMKRSEKGLPMLNEKVKKDGKNKVIRKIHPYKEKTVQEPKPKKEKKSKINILQQDVNVFKFFAFNKNNVKQMVVNFEVIKI